MNLELIGGLLAILTALVTSARYFFIRKIPTRKGIINAVLVHNVFGAIVFVPIAIILNYPFSGIPILGILIFIIAGALGAPIGWLVYESIRRVGASRTAPIIRGNILVASLIGVIILGETVGVLHSTGIILLFLGVVLISYKSKGDNTISKSISSSGIACPLIAMVIIGLEAPLVNYGYSEGVPVTMGIGLIRISSLIVILLFFKYKSWSFLNPFHSRERGLYLGAAASLNFGLAFMFLALSIASVSVVTPLRGMEPLFVLVMSSIYLKKLEKITGSLICGVLLTVIGAILIGLFM